MTSAIKPEICQRKCENTVDCKHINWSEKDKSCMLFKACPDPAKSENDWKHWEAPFPQPPDYYSRGSDRDFEDIIEEHISI